jgi:hypothetical protein
MPKVEIELDDLNHLKKQLEEKDKQLKISSERIYSLEQDSNREFLRNKAIDLASNLFDKYIGVVFRELGFKNAEYGNIDFSEYRNINYTNFYKYDDVKISLGAKIKTDFKWAFLSIGIIPPSELNKKDPLEID